MRGVEVLRQWIQDGKGGAERGLEGKLCSALCAMAEIYMSDLWCVFSFFFFFFLFFSPRREEEEGEEEEEG